jgi:hypothetical protein
MDQALARLTEQQPRLEAGTRYDGHLAIAFMTELRTIASAKRLDDPD